MLKEYLNKYDFIRYFLVGISTVVLDFILLLVFFMYLNIDKYIALTLAYSLASVFNFYMHKYFTFKSANSIKVEIFRFIIIVALSYLFTIFFIIILTSIGVDLFISKFISYIFIYIGVYMISKVFIFRRIEN